MSTQRGASRSREPRKSVLNRHDDANHCLGIPRSSFFTYTETSIYLAVIPSRGDRVINVD